MDGRYTKAWRAYKGYYYLARKELWDIQMESMEKYREALLSIHWRRRIEKKRIFLYNMSIDFGIGDSD